MISISKVALLVRGRAHHGRMKGFDPGFSLKKGSDPDFLQKRGLTPISDPDFR